LLNKNYQLEELITPELLNLVVDSIALKSKQVQNLKFNFFSLTSDFYYRENYHSFILKAFLEHPLFIRCFIETLSKNYPHITIFEKDYLDIEVLREVGRIDIWVRDLTTKKCIVIENKINDAVDMEKQLPRYVSYVKESQYEIDAIIYLSIDGKKAPDKSDWSIIESEEINNKLILLAAFDGGTSDLFTIFQKLELIVTNIDYLVLSRHYRDLITSLSFSIMKKPIHDSLYNLSKDENNFQKLRELSSLFNQLPALRARKIMEEFEDKCAPFKKVAIWTNKIAYFDEFIPNGSDCNFAIDVTCFEDLYVVDFFDRNALENDYSSSSRFLESKGINCFEKIEGNRRLKMSFQFPKNEDSLYFNLNELLIKLNK
jgi:hypothetical protein